MIGYVMVDSRYHIIGPPGTSIDPVFHCERSALDAAVRYGRSDKVHKISEQFLEGIFNVVVWDEGDMMLDGRCAQRFFKACKKRGLKPDKNFAKRINPYEKDNKYSSRKILADIELNRLILLSEP